MDYSKIRVLYYDTDIIKLDNILWGLVELGVDVVRSETIVSLQEFNEEQIKTVSHEAKDYDYVITQNFSVNVAEGAHLAGVRYISWIYDSPQITLYTDHAKYDTNYVFAFDKKQVKRLKDIGLKHVFYRPLAANMAYISSIKPDKSDSGYNADISFIGKLYRVGHIGILNNLSPELRDGILNKAYSLSLNWGNDKSIFESLSDEAVDAIEKFMPPEDFKKYHMDKKYSIEVLLMAPMIAQIERLNLLNLAASRYKVSLYTNDDDIPAASVIKGLNIHGPVKGDVPYRIYSNSKLNLNITNRSIETGAAQRIFDIMSAGGAVISNWQEELEELFIPDKEIVLFRSPEEFIDKADYYLKNPAERNKIAQKGHDRVKKDYNYVKSLDYMFKNTL